MEWSIPLPLHLIVAIKMGRPSLLEFHFFFRKKTEIQILFGFLTMYYWLSLDVLCSLDRP